MRPHGAGWDLPLTQWLGMAGPGVGAEPQAGPHTCMQVQVWLAFLWSAFFLALLLDKKVLTTSQSCCTTQGMGRYRILMASVETPHLLPHACMAIGKTSLWPVEDAQTEAKEKCWVTIYLCSPSQPWSSCAGGVCSLSMIGHIFAPFHKDMRPYTEPFILSSWPW